MKESKEPEDEPEYDCIPLAFLLFLLLSCIFFYYKLSKMKTDVKNKTEDNLFWIQAMRTSVSVNKQYSNHTFLLLLLYFFGTYLLLVLIKTNHGILLIVLLIVYVLD